MGIRFSDSILSLLAAACATFSAYFIGHALSAEHAGWAWVTAGGLIAAAALLTALVVRRLRSYPGPRQG